MKIIGERQLRVKDAYLPGDWQERLQRPNVVALADDYREREKLGLPPCIQPPKVRWSDRKIVIGRDRMAAWHVAFGDRPMPVIAMECTDVVLARDELTENVYRRHDTEERAANIRKLVAIRERELKELEQAKVLELSPKTAGRPASTKTKAMADVAKATATPLSTVRDVMAREAEEEAPPAACIEALGLEVPADVLEEAEKVQAACDEAHRAAVKIQGLLTKLGEIPRQKLKALARIAHELGNMARAERPTAVCPYCRLKTRAKCAGCLGLGWVGSTAYANAQNIRISTEPQKLPTASRGVQVEMSDGSIWEDPDAA